MSYYFSTTVNSSLAEAVAKTKAALAAAGFGILSEIDVSATLNKKIGVEIPPYLILGACNPHFAHQALKAESKIGVMLPCNVIVREQAPGVIEIAAVDPVASMQAIKNPQLIQTAATVRDLLKGVIDSL
jgi:uncharacterized protein (DUF302 family)